MPAYCTSATAIMLKNTREQVCSCVVLDKNGLPVPYQETGAKWRDYWLDALEDFPEDYDADWYALVGTRAIEERINWNLIAETLNEESLDDYMRLLFEDEWDEL